MIQNRDVDATPPPQPQFLLGTFLVFSLFRPKVVTWSLTKDEYEEFGVHE